MWVGISAKPPKNGTAVSPLSEESNSGKIIKKIENSLPNLSFYKTNLVKCPPLTTDGKLRYPTEKEQDHWYPSFINELKSVQPKLVFVLGSLVSNYIFKKNGVKKIKGFDPNFKYEWFDINNVHFVPIHHPSYIHVYKRKKIESYVRSIKNLIPQINRFDLNASKI